MVVLVSITISVYPSGVALATMALAIVPLAPVRFSYQELRPQLLG